MGDRRRVLLAGETWFSYGIHQKGFTAYTTGEYAQGCDEFVAALESAGWTVDHITNHDATTTFPTTVAELGQWDLVILSDIAADTLLLTQATFVHGRRSPDRLQALAEWVDTGGALLMVGGYMPFSGFEGKARYQATALRDCLPVTMLGYDDRVECPSGVDPVVTATEHPALTGVPTDWPWLLGYNRVIAKPDADVLLAVGEDPLLVGSRQGAGRTAAFTSDCSPHWGTPEFMAWPGYARLWDSLAHWLTGDEQTD